MQKIMLNTYIFLTFLVTCGGKFSASNKHQYISTPNWPDNYPTNQDCYWIIESEGGRGFDVILHQGQTELGFDFVEVSSCFEFTFRTKFLCMQFRVFSIMTAS